MQRGLLEGDGDNKVVDRTVYQCADDECAGYHCCDDCCDHSDSIRDKKNSRLRSVYNENSDER